MFHYRELSSGLYLVYGNGVGYCAVDLVRALTLNFISQEYKVQIFVSNEGNFTN